MLHASRFARIRNYVRFVCMETPRVLTDDPFHRVRTLFHHTPGHRRTDVTPFIRPGLMKGVTSEALGIDPAIRKPALTTPLPAGSQAMPQRQPGLPVVETDRLALQQETIQPSMLRWRWSLAGQC